MFKLGVQMLFWTFTQFISVIIAYQFYFRYSITHGGIGGTVLSNIHPIIWFIVFLELIFSIILIIKDDNKKIEDNVIS